MTYNIICVSDEETVIMFRLMGIDGYIIDPNDDDLFQETILDIVENQPSVGLIIINEKMLVRNQDLIIKTKLTKKLPLILEIPDIFGPLGKDYVGNLVRKYIGLEAIEDVTNN